MLAAIRPSYMMTSGAPLHESGQQVELPETFSGEGKGFDEFLASDPSSFPLSGSFSGQLNQAMAGSGGNPSGAQEVIRAGMAKARESLAPLRSSSGARDSVLGSGGRHSPSPVHYGWDSVAGSQHLDGSRRSPAAGGRSGDPVLRVDEGFRFSSMFPSAEAPVLKVEDGVRFSQFFPGSGPVNPSRLQEHNLSGRQVGGAEFYAKLKERLTQSFSGPPGTKAGHGDGMLATETHHAQTQTAASAGCHRETSSLCFESRPQRYPEPSSVVETRDPSFSVNAYGAMDQPPSPSCAWCTPGESEMAPLQLSQPPPYPSPQARQGTYHNAPQLVMAQPQHQHYHQQQQYGHQQQQQQHYHHQQQQQHQQRHHHEQQQNVDQGQLYHPQPAYHPLAAPRPGSACQPLAPSSSSSEGVHMDSSVTSSQGYPGTYYPSEQHQYTCPPVSPSAPRPLSSSLSPGQPLQLEERLKRLTEGHSPSSVRAGAPQPHPRPHPQQLSLEGQRFSSVSPSSSAEYGGAQGPHSPHMMPGTGGQAAGMPRHSPKTDPASGCPSPSLSRPASPLSAGEGAPRGGSLIGKKRGWAAKCAKDPMKYFGDQFCKGCKRLRRTSPEIRNMLLQLSAEAKEHSRMYGSQQGGSILEQLLPGRCSCGQTSSRKEPSAGSVVLLQLVQLDASEPYEPKQDQVAWRKYGDKSGTPSRPQGTSEAGTFARGRLYYKCTKCSKGESHGAEASPPSRAAKKMVQPVHCVPGLYLIRYEGNHSHAVCQGEGDSCHMARHVEGLLWEMDLSTTAGAECSRSVDDIEANFMEKCGSVVGGAAEEVLVYVRAALSGVPSLRKHVLARNAEHHMEA